MLNAFEAFEECERDRKFTNKRFLNHRALVRVGQIRAQLAKFIGRWKIEETSARENVFPVLKVDFFYLDLFKSKFSSVSLPDFLQMLQFYELMDYMKR